MLGAFCIGAQGQTETIVDLQGCIMAAEYGYRSDHGRNLAHCSTKYKYHQHDGLLRKIGRKPSKSTLALNSSLCFPLSSISDTPNCFPRASARISALTAHSATPGALRGLALRESAPSTVQSTSLAFPATASRPRMSCWPSCAAAGAPSWQVGANRGLPSRCDRPGVAALPAVRSHRRDIIVALWEMKM